MENQPQQIDIRFALQAAEIGAWEIGFDSNRFNCDEYCSAIFGTDLLNLSYNDLFLRIHSEQRKQVETAFRAALTPGSRGDFEANFHTVTGENTRVRMTGYCEFNEEGKPSRFAGIVQWLNGQQAPVANALTSIFEIDQEIKEKVLPDSEEEYHTLFNSIDQGCYIAEVTFDAHENPADIFYHDANPAAY